MLRRVTFSETKYGVWSIILGALSPVLLVVMIAISPNTNLPRLVAVIPVVGFVLGVLSVKTKAGAAGIFVNVLIEIFLLAPILFFYFQS
jgi:hypothetical protein